MNNTPDIKKLFPLLIKRGKRGVGFILYFLCSIFVTDAQNLVLNPSFENLLACPNYSNVFTAKQWWDLLTVHNDNPMILNSCAPTGTTMGAAFGIPQHPLGYSYPHSGNSMVMMCFLTNSTGVGAWDTRVYIQGKFSLPLKKDSLYCVNYYAKRVKYWAPIKYAIKNIDAYINDTLLHWNNYDYNTNGVGLVLKGIHPQIKNNKYVTDTSVWVCIQGIYKAKGGEKYITIGNFNDHAHTSYTVINNNALLTALWYYIDDVSVSPFSLQAPNLGKDTTVCAHQFPYILHAPIGYDSIVWSTGAVNTNSVSVTLPGKYWVRCVANGCGALTDTIVIKAYPTETLTMPADTFLCKGNTLVLAASGNFTSYLWNTGSTNHAITIQNGGVYTLTVSNICQTITKSVVVHLDSLPQLNISIGKDTNLCVTDSFGNAWNIPSVIYPNISPLPNYKWSTGSTTPFIVVTEEGSYWLRTDYRCGSIYSNTIQVSVCPPDTSTYFWIPNTFTPDGNNLNDYFYPVFQNKKIIEFKIYNRWGETIFEGNEQNLYKWDGKYKGTDCENGVYAYIITYQNDKPAKTNVAKTITGHINLIRMK